MATALVERTSIGELQALALYVAGVADHGQIDVTAGGVLAAERDGHPAGTPWVTVTVPTVAAADLAEQRLAQIARVDAPTWESGWRLIDGPALEIDVYPDADADADDIRRFVERELAAQACRRPDLEALVHERLAATAPDIAIVASGTDEEGGFVDIRVTSVDGADRAEHALVPFELKKPWRVDGRALGVRVYL